MTSKRRKFLITGIVAAIIFISGYIVYRVKKTSFLDKGLSELVSSKTDQLYKVKYDSIYVNEATGNLFLKNLHVYGDTVRQMKMIQAGDTNAVKVLLDIYVPLLKVSRFKTASALLSKQMDCNYVLVSKPVIRLYFFPGQGNQKDSEQQQKELYKQILGNLKLIRADSAIVADAEVIASDFFTKEVKFHGYNTNIKLTDVAIDSTYNQDTSRTFFCKQINVGVGKVILDEKNKAAEVADLTFDTRSKLLNLGRIDYDSYKNNGFFKTSFKGILIKGITWKGPVENSRLDVAEVTLNKGEIDTRQTAGGNKSKNSTDKPILTGYIKAFKLGTMHLKSVDFTSTSTDPKKKPIIINNNSFVIRNIELDSTSALNENLMKKAREIEFSNDEIALTSHDKKYRYTLTGLHVLANARKLTMRSVRIIPLFDEATFAKMSHYQTDRYDLLLQNIVCDKIDIEKLIKGEVDVEEITLRNNSLRVFRDLNYPVDSSAKQGKQESYPQQLLHTLKVPLNIKKITATNISIEYKERNQVSKNSGRVRFSNANMTITNVTNVKPVRNDKILVRFNTMFLEKIPITGSFIFYNDNWDQGKFTVNADVHSSIDATIFNQLTIPMSMAKIDKGNISSISFNFTGDTISSKGNLQLIYDDLKLTLLKKKGDEYRKKDVFSLLANIMVRNSNKPGNGMRTGKIEVFPNRYKSFFNFVWVSVFTGMRNVIMVKL